MTSIVLAGGENRRLPFIKSTVIVDGMSVFERILGVHRKIFKNIIVSTNNPALYFRFGLKMVGDVIDERGPMTGIFSSMINSTDERFFVTACDMPFLNDELIQYMIDAESETDAVIPMCNGEPQPLLGMYSRRLIGQLNDSIIQGKKSMKRFVLEIDTHFISEEEVRKIDPEGRSFTNINTVDDLKKIQGGNIC